MGVSSYAVAALAPDEAAREAAILRSGALSLSRHPALQAIVAEAARHNGTRCATISIIFRGWQYLIAAHGLAPGVTRRSSAFCAHAVLRPDRTFLVLDAAHDVRFAENPNVTDAPFIRFYAGAPLVQANGIAVGTLCVFDPSPRPRFDRAEEDALHAAARRTLLAIETLGAAIGQDRLAG